MLLAGPGSGKTKTLTLKVARILREDIQYPRGLACITFNTECARELQTRLGKLGINSSKNISIGTVHSFCLRNIVTPFAQLCNLGVTQSFKIATDAEQSRVFSKALTEIVSADERPSNWKDEFDRFRRTKFDLSPSQVSALDTGELEQLKLVERYEALLRNMNLIDFEDMVLLGLKIVKRFEWARKALLARFPVIVVDEYQDLGLPLHELISVLCFETGIRLIAVGDPDQSIYSFSGAVPQTLRDLAAREGVRAITLPFNYRSGKRIVSASEVALGEVRSYESKNIDHGTIEFHHLKDGLSCQAAFACGSLIPDILRKKPELKLSDFAILYVDKNDGDIVAGAAQKAGHNYIRIDRNAPYPKTPFSRWLEDCAAWCSGGWRIGQPQLKGILLGASLMLEIPYDYGDMHREILDLVSFLFSHRNGDVILRDWLEEFSTSCLNKWGVMSARFSDAIRVLEQIRSAAQLGSALGTNTVAAFGKQIGAPDHLNLITLHSAKGLEFQVVIMLGLEQGRLPWLGISAERVREARRLFYVGITRAKSEVHMLFSGSYIGRRGLEKHGASQFLLEVQGQLQ